MLGRGSTLSMIVVSAVLIQLSVAHADPWRVEYVEELTAVACSIDVDAAGIPHLAFYPGQGIQLHYGRRDPATGWFHDVVDSRVSVAEDVVLRLDAGGQPRIAYTDPAFGLNVFPFLKVAELVEGTWRREVVAPRVAYFLSMALYGPGEPFLVYADFADDFTMHFGRRRDGVWITRKLTNNSIGGTAVAFDALGFLHIAYLDGRERAIKYARAIQGVWHFEHVEILGDMPLPWPSLALDRTGQPTIAYQVGDRIRIAERRAGIWRLQTLEDPNGLVTEKPILRLDSTGNLHLAYAIRAPGPFLFAQLRYARLHRDSGWELQTVDEINSTIRGVSFALDRDGAAHISYLYLDGVNFLRYATNRVATYAGRE